MARSVRSAAIWTQRSGTDLSLTSRLCLMFTSLRRVRNLCRFIAFLHGGPLSSSFDKKERHGVSRVPSFSVGTCLTTGPLKPCS
jgi:hypothetical protein